MLRHPLSFVARASTAIAALGKGKPVPSFGVPSLWFKNYREFATVSSNSDVDITKLRNIGISAHIDSGKTTLTERILFYTGRINDIHEVRGKDKVGAKMDSMDLEREKGITIQSAATYCVWGENRINIIDTPGHVDFTIEVERALRVLDGAVLVICGVGGVQSQTFTVDRQMKRYNVPRVVFINKLDRLGADPVGAIAALREKLSLNVAQVQIPIGLENNLSGVVDIITGRAYHFEGYKGGEIREVDPPGYLAGQITEMRNELIENIGNVDDEVGEWMVENDFPNNNNIPTELLKAAVRRQTIARRFAPVFLGSAFKNIGVQLLLNGVVDYLPNPTEKLNEAINALNEEETVALKSDVNLPLVGLAFKLEEGQYGQLTYMRIYQGKIKRGDTITNVNTGKPVKVPRLVKMHSNEMEEIAEAGVGEICAMFGVDCHSGNTFTTQNTKLVMSRMHVPDPVISLSLTQTKKEQSSNFGKALQKFQKEDPTFRVKMDPESGQTIISGMGELHLFIYVERMKREYGVDCVTGKPLVAFRETIGQPYNFDYTHRKQTGGAGQYARVAGTLEPIDFDSPDPIEFVDETVGGSIPPHFMEAVRKGFWEGCDKGPLLGQPITGIRMVVKNGAYHAVDSSDLAFKICTASALREGLKNAQHVILQPVMDVEVQTPAEFQGAIVAQLAKRKAVIETTNSNGVSVTITCLVPLNEMFGYSTDLRSATQGKAEYAMEYKTHMPVPRGDMNRLIDETMQLKADEARATSRK